PSMTRSPTPTTRSTTVAGPRCRTCCTGSRTSPPTRRRLPPAVAAPPACRRGAPPLLAADGGLHHQPLVEKIKMSENTQSAVTDVQPKAGDVQPKAAAAQPKATGRGRKPIVLKNGKTLREARAEARDAVKAARLTLREAKAELAAATKAHNAAVRTEAKLAKDLAAAEA